METSIQASGQNMPSASPVNSDPDYKWRVLGVIIFGTFMVILDSTAVNVAVPTLQTVFGSKAHPAAVDQVDAVLTSYILALGIVTPLAGYLAERFGIKLMYLISLSLFVVGSFLCSLAPSLGWLVAFRALQGLGGGMISPLGLSLLFSVFSEKERGMAFGIYGIPLVVAPASGPVLGGYFVQYLSWHYIFYVNIPICIAGVILGMFWLKEVRRGTTVRLDILGVILSIISFGCLLYGIESGQDQGWNSPRILTLLIVGGVALVAFIIVELFTRDPLLDLRLFARRSFASANIVGWVSSIALFGAEFLLPLYLQILRGKTPLEAGLLVLPLALAAGIATPLGGFLYNKIGPRWLIIGGSILLAINTWEFAHLDLTTSYVNLDIDLAIRGVALGLILQPTLSVAAVGLKQRQIPRASSLLSATRNVWQSFGIAILGTIVTTQRNNYITSATNDLKHASTALGKQALQIAQGLMQKHVPMAQAFQAAVGQLMPHIVQDSFMRALNDAYYVTFWLSLAALVLAFTLPSRARVLASTSDEDESRQEQQGVQPVS